MYTTNLVNGQKDPQERRILVLCKEVSVVNPETPGIETQALILFDQGAQLSFVSKGLADRLSLKGITEGISIASATNYRRITTPQWRRLA
uniref:DUF1758 domain-containing protein n=1 Tax=Loa loa TaxID=7209 RepID=A0A1I7VB22_LOALO